MRGTTGGPIAIRLWKCAGLPSDKLSLVVVSVSLPVDFRIVRSREPNFDSCGPGPQGSLKEVRPIPRHIRLFPNQFPLSGDPS